MCIGSCFCRVNSCSRQWNFQHSGKKQLLVFRYGCGTLQACSAFSHWNVEGVVILPHRKGLPFSFKPNRRETLLKQQVTTKTIPGIFCSSPRWLTQDWKQRSEWKHHGVQVFLWSSAKNFSSLEAEPGRLMRLCYWKRFMALSGSGWARKPTAQPFLWNLRAPHFS